MKSNFLKSLRRASLWAGGALAALLCGGSAGNASQSLSPVGTWDCTIANSHQKGMAFLTFSDDGTNKTFTGFRLFVGKNDLISTNSDPRGTAIRNGTGSSTNSFTNAFGFDEITGPWQFDERGRIVGRFADVSLAGTVTCTTNETVSTVNEQTTVPVSNPDGSVTYITTNITIFVTNAPTTTCVTNTGITNAVSFIGHAGRKSLTLVSSTVNGRVTYSGRPYSSNLVDLSGDWFATSTENRVNDLLFFTLNSFGQGDVFGDFPGITNFPNIYFVTNGTGANSSFFGVGALSGRKKLGLVFTSGSTNGTFTATIGTLSAGRTIKANTSGEDLATDPPASVKIRAVKQ
jgi:hypothetical protein